MGSKNWQCISYTLAIIMLASQLSVFDDKTDLKWKWVKKLIVW